jgi:hypothetical protein
LPPSRMISFNLSNFHSVYSPTVALIARRWPSPAPPRLASALPARYLPQSGNDFGYSLRRTYKWQDSFRCLGLRCRTSTYALDSQIRRAVTRVDRDVAYFSRPRFP